MIPFVQPYSRSRAHRYPMPESLLPFYTLLPLVPSVVFDGDSLTASVRGQLVSIRIRSIDAPEMAQPYGPEARSALIDLLRTTPITCKLTGLDKYHRYLADIFPTPFSRIQDPLVSGGFVWVYDKFAAHEHTLKSLEQTARDNRIGLWEQPNPEPPWDFRNHSLFPPLPPESFVFITLRGKSFHRRTCSCLRYPISQTTRAKAVASGFLSCGLCHS
jgi:endonuclease YncB( thermonuclease family)